VKTADLHQPAPRPLKSGLITLKAETDLGITPSTIDEGLTISRARSPVHSAASATAMRCRRQEGADEEDETRDMLDLKLIREHTDLVREGVRKKGEDPASVDEVLRLDEHRRALIQETEV